MLIFLACWLYTILIKDNKLVCESHGEYIQGWRRVKQESEGWREKVEGKIVCESNWGYYDDDDQRPFADDTGILQVEFAAAISTPCFLHLYSRVRRVHQCHIIRESCIVYITLEAPVTDVDDGTSNDATTE